MTTLSATVAAPVVRAQRRGTLLWLTGSNPPVNALSRAVRQALVEGIAQGTHDPDIAAIVVRCDGSTFFAGADLAELEHGIAPPGLDAFVAACEACPKPIVAALHGTTFGGGVVVAYACDYRIALPDTRFAMPEVSLGLLPTYGGTQYLPRLVGIECALELIVDGRQWSAARAHEAGLIDAIAEPDALEATAERLALGNPVKRPTRAGTRQRIAPAAAAALFDARRARAVHEAPGFIAPLACLDAMQAGLALPLPEALRLEHEAFLRLLDSEQSRRLRALFFAEREVRRGGFDRPAVECRLLAAGVSSDALARVARELLTERAVPNAAVLDALAVALFRLPRHAPSPLGGIL